MRFRKNKSILIEEATASQDQILITDSESASENDSAFSRAKLYMTSGIVGIGVICLGIWVLADKTPGISEELSEIGRYDQDSLIISALPYTSTFVFTDWMKDQFSDISSWNSVLYDLEALGWHEELHPESVSELFHPAFPTTRAGLLLSLSTSEKVWIFPYRPEVSLDWTPVETAELPYEKQLVLQKDMIEQLVDSVGPELDWPVLLQLEEVLSWSIGLRELRAGDSISLVGRKIISIKTGREQVVLDGLQVTLHESGYRYQAFRQSAEKNWINAEGIPMKRRFLSSPVSYGSISSRYNLTRLHPVLKKIRAHKGTDFAAPEGTPIRTIADGKVTRMEYKSNNGNFVEITHDESFRTMYLHMSEFPSRLKIGDLITQGTIIGYVGSTGLSTGPHVCLRFWVRDRQDDFLSVIRNYPVPYRIASDEWRAFIPFRDSLLFTLNNWKPVVN